MAVMRRSAGGETGKVPREGYAVRFERLLKAFPRADGEPWRPTEIQHATGGMVSRSYVSAISKGKIKRPGERKLSYIADVVGFPETLWYLEPKLWDEELDRHPNKVGLRSLRAARLRWALAPDPYSDILVPPPPVGGELATMVEALFVRYPDLRTGNPYDEHEIAARSESRLTAQEVRSMRGGEQERVPRWADIMALADAFGISLVRWFRESGRSLMLNVDGIIRKLEDESVDIRFGDYSPLMSERHVVAWLMRLASGDLSRVMVDGARDEEPRASEAKSDKKLSGENHAE